MILKFHSLKIIAAVAFFAAVIGANAQTLTTNSYFQSVNTVVPDNDSSGLASAINVSGIYGTITDISLTLNISGGYNGDLYAYLVNTNTGVFSVLLNRVGVQNGNDVGYGDSGFAVTFGSGVTNDIHFYQDLSYTLDGNNALLGTWGADGRDVDPATNSLALGDAPQTALLDSFLGTNPNGSWTLFLADMNFGDESTLQSWQFDVVTVPEPGTSVLFALAGGGALIFLRRRVATKKC